MTRTKSKNQMNNLQILMPYPPSGNHMWKHTTGGKHYLTAKARSYYDEVKWIVASKGDNILIDYPINVTCMFYPPDKRRRDLDNAWKVISDSLTKANVWTDDHLIRCLTLEWAQPIKGGKCTVFVSPR